MLRQVCRGWVHRHLVTENGLHSKVGLNLDRFGFLFCQLAGATNARHVTAATDWRLPRARLLIRAEGMTAAVLLLLVELLFVGIALLLSWFEDAFQAFIVEVR
jgi:hypothetical protein